MYHDREKQFPAMKNRVVRVLQKLGERHLLSVGFWSCDASNIFLVDWQWTSIWTTECSDFSQWHNCVSIKNDTKMKANQFLKWDKDKKTEKFWYFVLEINTISAARSASIVLKQTSYDWSQLRCFNIRCDWPHKTLRCSKCVQLERDIWIHSNRKTVKFIIATYNEHLFGDYLTYSWENVKLDTDRRNIFFDMLSWISVMCSSHFCRDRVMSPSSQSRVESESSWVRVELSQSRVESESSWVRVELSQSRVTRMIESLRVTCWHARVNVSHTNFKLFLYIFGYPSASGSSVAIGPPVDLPWLLVHQWTFSGNRSTKGPSIAIGPPVDLQWL